MRLSLSSCVAVYSGEISRDFRGKEKTFSSGTRQYTYTIGKGDYCVSPGSLIAATTLLIRVRAGGGHMGVSRLLANSSLLPSLDDC